MIVSCMIACRELGEVIYDGVDVRPQKREPLKCPEQPRIWM